MAVNYTSMVIDLVNNVQYIDVSISFGDHQPSFHLQELKNTTKIT